MSDYLAKCVSAKVTNEEHTLVFELAASKYNGNISLSLRHIIREWIQYSNDGNVKMPASVKLAVKRYERQLKEKDKEQLRFDYVSLRHNYDKEFEDMLKEFAREKGLSYPPDIEQLSIVDMDRNLNATLHAVKITCNGSKETSLREIYRQTGRSKEETLTHLGKLKDLGHIDFDQKGQSCVVTLIKE